MKKKLVNIDGTIIHSNLSIPLNCKYLPSLCLERLDNLIEKYDQLQLIALEEISLIGKKILKFVDFLLTPIKHVHPKFFGNFDVIGTRIFIKIS